MKKISILLAFVMVFSLLAACGGTPTETTPQNPVQSTPTEAAPQWTAVLYADFSCGSTDPQYIQQYPFEYTGSQKTAEEIAAELSHLTGLDFTITASQSSDGWVVDWRADSTLIAGLDDRQQKEEFFFHDIDTLCWFMMDSLWRTLSDHLDTENIYYTMDGGQELAFEALSPVSSFPSDVPYMGSAFYAAHAGNQGEDTDDPFARTKGLWRLDGAAEASSIRMDGMGGFAMYDASGNVEAEGHLDYIDEYGDGSLRYDLYTHDGVLMCSFYFDSDTQIHVGNYGEDVYLLDENAHNGPVSTDAYLGYWMYDNGYVLRLDEAEWYLYDAEGMVLDNGPMGYDEEAAYLMNSDGSSGGGVVYFNDNGELTDLGEPLTRLEEFPFGQNWEGDPNAQLLGEWLFSDQENILWFDGVEGFTWQFPYGTDMGSYVFDGENLVLYQDGSPVARGYLDANDHLHMEGDGESYYYRSK